MDERPLLDGRDGLVVLGRSVAYDGSLMLLTSPDRPPTTRYSVLRIQPPYRLGDESIVERIDVKTPSRTLHFAQPIGEDLLLVSGRARRTAQGAFEVNALVVGHDGSVTRQMALGDGIEDVQVTRDGDVWVSYFDEGVLGALSHHPEALGATGLEHLDSNGDRIAALQPPTEVGSVCDCYALNVASHDDVYIAYHPQFPLVRLTNDGSTIRTWSNAPRGTHAFAIDGSTALFQGGYGQEDHYVLCSLDGDHVSERQTYRFRDTDGHLLAHCRAIGRGTTLWLADGTHWFKVDLRSPPWA
ncbi:MAG: hypothetical protein U0165_20475 [Polyangiaceae bacterium]